MKPEIAELRPKTKLNIIDLLRAAGFNVADWSNFSGVAAANPKYCYEWCFVEGDKALVNIWFENLSEHDGTICQDLNMRLRANTETGPRKARAKRFDRTVRDAYHSGADLKAIILDRPTAGSGNVTGRALDKVLWHVASYDDATGAFRLARGARQSLARETAYDTATQEFLEGQTRAAMIKHRKRERAARTAKIEQALAHGNGRLLCEVPGCGFDFLAVYGEAGRGYAHVHHKVPLATLPLDGGKVRLSDLVVVCANCHAMIHRGGGCREMAGLIPRKPCHAH